MRLKQKIFGPLLLITLIPMIIIGGFAYFYIRTTTQQTILSNVTDVSQTLIHAIENRISTAKANLKLFANSRLLQDYIRRGDERFGLLQSSLIRLFMNYQDVHPDYFSIMLLDENGEVDTYVDSRPGASDPYTHSSLISGISLKDITPGQVIEQIVHDSDQTDPIMNLIISIDRASSEVSINSPDIEEQSHLVLSMSLVYVQAILDTLASENSGMHLITDRTGRVLYSNHGSFSPDELSPNELTPNDSGYHEYVGPGNRYVTVISTMNSGLTLYSMVSMNRFDESANTLATRMLFAVLMVIVFILLMSFFYIKRILLDPIYQLRSLVTDIGNGVMDSEPSIRNRDDELSDLSQSIFSMRENIQANNRQIEKLAYFDTLTGLPNRVSFKIQLKKTLALCAQAQQQCAIVFLDLDNFKYVNDTLGHDVGDKLLIEVTNRIRALLQDKEYEQNKQTAPDHHESVLVRLGGDEFTLLITAIQDVDRLNVLLQQLLDSISTPFLIDGNEMIVGASIGVSMFPDHGKSPSELLKNADLAMYEAKRSGKNCFRYFSEEIRDNANESQAMESELRFALEHDEFSLHFQPRLHTDGSGIDGFEALIRWNNINLGEVSPRSLIHLAESNLQIIHIGDWVLDQACSKMSQWKEMGFDDICLSINISPIQILSDDFYTKIKSAMLCHGIDGKNLELEVTETSLLEDEQRTIQVLNKIRSLGVRISLDDFGTGYSSLSKLRILPIDIIKIDRSFIKDISTNSDTAKIFDTIIRLSRTLNLKTVAEGIETEEQHQQVMSAHCDFVQGYYYAKPMPEQFADKFLIGCSSESDQHSVVS